MSDADGIFLKVLLQHAPYNSIKSSTFMLICCAGYAEFKGPKTLSYNTAYYRHLFQTLHSVVPATGAEDIHCFIKEVLTIIEIKGWTGIHCTTRTAHVTKAWQIIAQSRWTSQTRVVAALSSECKLYEAVSMVYVYALMDSHTNPQAIYCWAYRCLVA